MCAEIDKNNIRKNLNDNSLNEYSENTLTEIVTYKDNRLLEIWLNKYALAKEYFKHYGNLEIPLRFKTKDGYTYARDGIALGTWLNTQRMAFSGKSVCTLADWQITLLKEIGMRFEVRNNKDEWNKKYNLAKEYFKHHENLEMPTNFKTKDGYTYDRDGIALGTWINTQKLVFNHKTSGILTNEQIELLKKIGMNFQIKNFDDEWNKKYNLAKEYFKHYGNLEIPLKFKTKDGYTYDETGVAIGEWIVAQRKGFIGKDGHKLTDERINLLKEIGMRFKFKSQKNEWLKNYNLAKGYFKYHGNLKIPVKFKTKDGYTYDEDGSFLGLWLDAQRRYFKGNGLGRITDERIKLLNEIGIDWFINEKKDNKLQQEEITDLNRDRKKIEILNRFVAYLSPYDIKEAPDKNKINQSMLDKLNHVK